MLKKICFYSHKIFSRTFALTLIFCIAILAGFFTWVITGPRSLSYLTPYLEGQLNKINQGISSHIQTSQIAWDPIKKQVAISATNVEFLNSTNDLLATIPKVSFEFNLFRLLMGSFLSSDITLVEPSLYITTNDQHIYVRSKKDQTNAINLLDALHHYVNANAEVFNVHRVNLERASIYIDNGRTNTLWTINDGFIQVNKEYLSGPSSKSVRSEFSVQSEVFSPIHLAFRLTSTKNQTTDINVSVRNFSSKVLEDLFPAAPWASIADTETDADFHMILANNELPPTFDFSIHNSSGKIILPQFFERPIDFSSVKAKGSFILASSTLKLDNFEVLLGKKKNAPKFSLDGTFSNLFSLPSGATTLPGSPKPLPTLIFNTKIESLNINDLKYYWPIPLRPKLREWISTRLSEGRITSATGQFKIMPEDIALINHHEEIAKTHPEQLASLPLPSPELLHATLNVENTNVNYFPSYPIAQHVDATINFDYKKMEINIAKGSLLESKIKPSTLVMENMWLKPSYLTLKGDVEGKTENFMEFLKASLKDNKTKDARLKSILNTTGLMTGHIELSFPVKPESLLYDDLDLSIQANLSRTKLPNILNKFSLENGELQLTLKNRKCKVAGKGTIQNTPFTIDYTQNFSSTATKIQENQNRITAKVTADELRQLGIVDIPYIYKPFDIDITLTETSERTNLKGSVDLTQATMSWPEYHFHKEAGETATLNLDGSFTKKNLTLSSFTLKGNKIDIQGKLSISGEQDKKIDMLDLPILKFNNNNAAVQYAHTSDGYSITLKGEKLDLSEAPLENIFKQTKVPQALRINADIKNFIMKNNITLSNLKATIDCLPKRCQAIDVQGVMGGDSYLNAVLQQENQHNILVVTSNNAGLVASGLGISKHIKGGILNIQTSAEQDSTGTLITRGTVQIENFKAVELPFLSKLLTLASLKGYTDLLGQEGISFDKFEAPLTIQDGIITIKEARSSGSSIGITSDGTINTKTNQVKIRGVLVPAQEINKIIGKIPLLGNIIIGGKNQGIIATNYSIEGNYDDAKVSVNPLSILTPSFMRQIFKILPGS